MKPMNVPLDSPRIKTLTGTMACSSLRPGDWLERIADHKQKWADVVVLINSSNLKRTVYYSAFGEYAVSHTSIAETFHFIGHGKRRWWVRGCLKKFFCEFSRPL